MILRLSVIFVPALLIFCLPRIEAKKFADDEEHRQWQEFKEFLQWKKSRDLAETSQEENVNGEETLRSASVAKLQTHPRDEKSYEKHQRNPPPIDKTVLMARYIVNQAEWTSVATISARKEIQSFPFANVISFSDGPLGNGSGIPYMYLTPLDFTAQDLAKDNRATLLMTLAQGNYCKDKLYDPMDPRCARITLTGKIKSLKNDSAEMEVAKSAIFGRHAWLAHMPRDHHFYFAKLKISSIALLDTFGGPKYIPVKDYLHPPTPNVTEDFFREFSAKMVDDAKESEEMENTDRFRFLQPSVRVV